MWLRNVSPITAKGRVSLFNKGMGNNFYIGTFQHAAARVRVRPLRLTARNNGRSPDPNDSNFAVHSSRYLARVFCSLIVESDAVLPDDDDDIDESAIPAFSHPTMRPNTPPLNKGKYRVSEQSALPASSGPTNQLSGNIGTPVGGATRGARQDFGGIQVESRSHTVVPFTHRHGIDPPSGPEGSIPLTNRSHPPSSVTPVGHQRRVLTVRQIRDLKSIYQKLIQVLYPPRGGFDREALR